MSDKDFEPFYKELADCLERRKTLQEKKTAAGAAAEKLAEWGDFSPEELRELKDQGFDIHVYRTDKKTMAALAADPEVQIIRLAPVGKMPTLASIGPLPGTYPVTEFPIPDKGAGQLRRERDDCDQGLRSCQAFLTEAAKHLPSIHDQMLKTQNAAEYSSVSNTSQSQDGLVWLTGYIPAAEVEGFKKAAAQAHWAWAMEDPAADDDKVTFGRTGGHEERPVLPFALAAQHDAAAVDADRAGNPVDASLEQDRPRLRAVDRLLDQGRGIAPVGWRREGFDHGDVGDGPVAPAVAHAAEVGNHVPGLLPGGHVVGLDDRIAQIGRGRRRSRIAAVIDPVRRTAQQPEGGQQNELMNRMIPSHLSKILWVPFHR